MRKFTLLLSAIVLGTIAHAQTIATFEGLTLPKSDTFYVNYSSPLADVGFNDGLAHFPCVYDTAWGGVWSGGFSYSNMTDSVTSGFGNDYSAKTAKGYNNSAQYAVAWCNDASYQPNITLKLIGAAIGKSVNGFYVTNSTFAYNNMRDGGAPGKKFGGGLGNDADWFLLTVKGYRTGALTADSVNFYLADFRGASGSDYIVKTWEWVNLLPLGHVDSLHFHLSSSDNGGGFMNTPSYFCMDNFTTDENNLAVNSLPAASIAKVYPNPAHDVMYVDIADNSVQHIAVMDVTGKIMDNYTVTQPQVAVNTANLPAGIYVLQLSGNGKTVSAKFVKQ
jgi:hypothetical protein